VAQVALRRRHLRQHRPETVAWVTSLPPTELDATAWLAANRDAWGIENGRHQRLDPSQREDESRVRTPRSLQVLGMLRRFSVSIGMALAESAAKAAPEEHDGFLGRDGRRRSSLRPLRSAFPPSHLPNPFMNTPCATSHIVAKVSARRCPLCRPSRRCKLWTDHVRTPSAVTHGT